MQFLLNFLLLNIQVEYKSNVNRFFSTQPPVELQKKFYDTMESIELPKEKPIQKEVPPPPSTTSIVQKKIRAVTEFTKLEKSLTETRGSTSSEGLKFAVVHIAGHQHKVTKSDILVTEKLDGLDIGDEIKLHRVLLIGTQNYTIIGKPIIDHAFVYARVEEQTKAAKVIIFKKRRRKNSRRRNGHRQPITVLTITDIESPTVPNEVAKVLESRTIV